MSEEPIRVLVVEDDPVAADAHVMYVGRVPGFVAVGKAHTGAEARRLLDRTPVDLLLLDLHLPDAHGLQLARSLRAAGYHADVIAVTSARDLTVVREGVSLGVVQYVLKPFTFATLRDRLVRYAEFRGAAGEASGQCDVGQCGGRGTQRRRSHGRTFPPRPQDRDRVADRDELLMDRRPNPFSQGSVSFPRGLLR